MLDNPVDDRPSGSPGNVFHPQLSFFGKLRFTFSRRYQKLLDDLHPYPWVRWAGFFGLLLFYILRVYWIGGFYIISYGLAIYLLNILIGVLAPKFEPETLADEETGDDAPALPTANQEKEFKPFIRRLPEFKAWHSSARAVLISIVCTLFRILDIPVFWPILVIYFLALFVVTMRKQIEHMIKYKYIPISLGKPKYKGKSAK